jgi:hypothetical protein
LERIIGRFVKHATETVEVARDMTTKREVRAHSKAGRNARDENE